MENQEHTPTFKVDIDKVAEMSLQSVNPSVNEDDTLKDSHVAEKLNIPTYEKRDAEQAEHVTIPDAHVPPFKIGDKIGNNAVSGAYAPGSLARDPKRFTTANPEVQQLMIDVANQPASERAEYLMKRLIARPKLMALYLESKGASLKGVEPTEEAVWAFMRDTVKKPFLPAYVQTHDQLLKEGHQREIAKTQMPKGKKGLNKSAFNIRPTQSALMHRMIARAYPVMPAKPAPKAAPAEPAAE